jgi:hypothetical protein
MESCSDICPTGAPEITFNLGTFEGFNFRTQSAILRTLTAADVVGWDHDRQGEAEFWPAGDRPEVALLFKNKGTVTGPELLELDRLLTEMRGDSVENFLWIHYVVNTCGAALEGLTRNVVEDANLEIFLGSDFIELREEAAYSLFQVYYGEEYDFWERSHCEGLIFDVDRFLDSSGFSVEEVYLGNQKALLIALG